MGKGYDHMGCTRWAREMRGLCEMGKGELEIRESESCACGLVSERAER